MSATEAEMRAEMFAAARRVDRRALDFLKSRGLTGAAFVACDRLLDGFTPALGVARIEADGDLYSPADDGRAAFVLAVADGGGSLCDIVAFRGDAPCRWWLRRGDAAVLGEAAIDHAIALEQPLAVLSSPLDWLVASGDGVVLLGPPHRWRVALAGAGRLLVHDEHLAEAIDQEVNRRPVVEIRTWSARDAAA